MANGLVKFHTLMTADYSDRDLVQPGAQWTTDEALLRKSYSAFYEYFPDKVTLGMRDDDERNRFSVYVLSYIIARGSPLVGVGVVDPFFSLDPYVIPTSLK
jgi:hypothetical protein